MMSEEQEKTDNGEAETVPTMDTILTEYANEFLEHLPDFMSSQALQQTNDLLDSEKGKRINTIQRQILKNQAALIHLLRSFMPKNDPQ